jgi:phosphatidylglycerol---prolipoprotein diacylglyceryl transferase
MHPVIFTLPLPSWLAKIANINELHIYSYAVMITLGALLACIIIQKQVATKLAFTLPNKFYYFSFLAGFVGGKLFYYLEKPIYFVNNFSEAAKIFSGGFVCYGSVIFMLGYFVYYTRKQHIALLPFLDIAVVACVIPQVLGRLGCFFAGCCYGKPSNAFTSFVFPNVTDAAVHPTQLYEAVLMTVVFFCLLHINKRHQKNGLAFCFYIISYALVRFGLEFTRGDIRGVLFNGLLSHSQTMALATFLIAITLFIKNKFTLKPLKQIK